MAATYDPTLPTRKDRARLELDDRTVGGLEVFQDEEINSQLDRYGWNLGLSRLARSAAQHYANIAEEWAEADVKKKYTDRAEFYLKMADWFLTHLDPDFGPAVDATTGSPYIRELTAPDLTDYRPD